MAESNSKFVPATPTTVICPLDDITPDGPDHVLATPTAVSTAGCRTVWHVMLSCWVVKSWVVLGWGTTLTVGWGTGIEMDYMLVQFGFNTDMNDVKAYIYTRTIVCLCRCHIMMLGFPQLRCNIANYCTGPQGLIKTSLQYCPWVSGKNQIAASLESDSFFPDYKLHILSN